MNVIEHHIQIRKTAQYYTSGPAEAPIKWLICHGYGQLAERIIKKFSDLENDRLVSVEGLHRFYWKGMTGEVAASWMTKKNRLEEIEDFSHLLSTVYQKEITEGQRVFLGFSQGGTTIWRWIHRHQPDFNVFINWAGWIPEDIDLLSLKEYLIGKTLVFAYGDKDEYLFGERLKYLNEVIKANDLNISIVKYNGVHKIDRKVLLDIYKKYVKQ